MIKKTKTNKNVMDDIILFCKFETTRRYVKSVSNQHVVPLAYLLFNKTPKLLETDNIIHDNDINA